MIKQHIGHIVQLAGAVAVLAGIVRTFHSPFTAGLILGGLAAFFVGKYIQAKILALP